MRVHVLGSSSLGNALLFAWGPSRVLVDAGVGPRACAERLRRAGDESFPRGVDGIVVTHHHDDHSAKVGPLARATGAPVWLHDGVDLPRARRKLDVRRYDTRAPFSVGAFAVEAFALPHDAPQVALRLSAGGRTVGVVTDAGHVPRGLEGFLAACDEILLEANYCPEMLAASPYPPSLRRRIAGPEGHLSNADAAALVARLAGTRVSRVHVCHVSEHNNTPERAARAVRERSGAIAVGVLPREGGVVLDVGAPAAAPARVSVQLDLFGP